MSSDSFLGTNGSEWRAGVVNASRAEVSSLNSPEKRVVTVHFRTGVYDYEHTQGASYGECID